MFDLIYKIVHMPYDDEGATVVEYAILAAMIAIVSIVITTSMGESVSTTFSVLSSSLEASNG